MTSRKFELEAKKRDPAYRHGDSIKADRRRRYAMDRCYTTTTTTASAAPTAAATRTATATRCRSDERSVVVANVDRAMKTKKTKKKNDNK